MVKTIYTYGFHELFLKSTEQKQAKYKRFMHLRKQKIKIFKKKSMKILGVKGHLHALHWPMWKQKIGTCLLPKYNYHL